AVERNLATYEAKFLIERKKAPQARFCSVIGAAFWNSSRSYKPKDLRAVIEALDKGMSEKAEEGNEAKTTPSSTLMT
ncbi:MAG: hypothetical protein M1561_01960, partial [Gammaproteobacteria bacterium]|nr:hypothetical protein [Gammaproteobacteria bacterium]